MRFLFRLDLSLHTGAEKKFGIWNLEVCNQTRTNRSVRGQYGACVAFKYLLRNTHGIIQNAQMSEIPAFNVQYQFECRYLY